MSDGTTAEVSPYIEEGFLKIQVKVQDAKWEDLLAIMRNHGLSYRSEGFQEEMFKITTEESWLRWKNDERAHNMLIHDTTKNIFFTIDGSNWKVKMYKELYEKKESEDQPVFTGKPDYNFELTKKVPALEYVNTLIELKIIGASDPFTATLE